MKKLISSLLIILTLVSVVGCAGDGGNADAKPQNDSNAGSADAKPQNDSNAGNSDADTIVIGGLAPLTGNVSQYGIATNNGILLAVEEINAKGGILGKQITFIPEDEQGDPTEAINAYNKLVQNDNIIALVGDVTTKPTIAVAQRASRDGIPMITPTATGADVTAAGENIFRACFIDPFQGELMAHYAFDKLNAKSVAVLYDSGDDYSSGIAETFKSTSEELGVEVVNYEGYSSGIDDFNAQLTKIKASNPDLIFLPVYYDDASKILVQAKRLEINAIFAGADGWDGVAEKLDASNLDVLDNTYYGSQYSRQSEDSRVQKFISDYKAAYKMDENMFAVLGYDAMMIMADAISRAGSTDSEAIVKALGETEFEGLTGTTVFDENRNPVREAYITTFENGEATVKEVYDIK